MEESELTIEQQIKLAKKEKLLAEANKAKAEKKKIDLESKELKKGQSLKHYQKKEFWPLLIGTLVAWTAVAYYVVPLTEIHNNQVTLDNTKKSDSLYNQEKQLKIAFDTLRRRELVLKELAELVNRQRIENSLLKNSRDKVDSTYSVFYNKYLTEQNVNSVSWQVTLTELKESLDQYKKQKTASSFGLGLPNYSSSLERSFVASKSSLQDYLATGSGLVEPQNDLSSYFKELAAKSNQSRLSGTLLTSHIIIRPIYNNTLISDLKIKISAIPDKLSNAVLTLPSFFTNQEVVYSGPDGYNVPYLSSGNYRFELNTDKYRIVSVGKNGSIMFPGNEYSLNMMFGEPITIDLNLEVVEQ